MNTQMITDSMAAAMIAKIIIDLFRYYNVKNGNTTPSWVWPPVAVLLGCAASGLLFVAAGGVLTVQSSAQQIIIGILAAGQAIGVTELQKRVG
jgi:hypothetical protein